MKNLLLPSVERMHVNTRLGQAIGSRSKPFFDRLAELGGALTRQRVTLVLDV